MRRCAASSGTGGKPNGSNRQRRLSAGAGRDGSISRRVCSDSFAVYGRLPWRLQRTVRTRARIAKVHVQLCTRDKWDAGIRVSVQHRTRTSACTSTWLSRERVGRNTSPCTTQAVHFKYTASQSVNSESDLSLRGPESTVWCTMVPTSGSLHRPMLQFVSCFQRATRGGGGGGQGRARQKSTDTHGSLMRRTYVVAFRLGSAATFTLRRVIGPFNVIFCEISNFPRSSHRARTGENYD